MKQFARSAATTVAMIAGLGLAGWAAAVDAQAQPAPMPDYHWCPGDYYDPAWGPNWDWGECHDDFHRDRDGDDHSRDFRDYDDRGRGPGRDDRGPGWEGRGPEGPGPGR